MTEKQGFYIRNKTNRTRVFESDDGGFAFTMQPRGDRGDIVYVPEKYTDTFGIKRLLTSQAVEVVDSDGAVAAEVAAARQRKQEEDEARAGLIENVDTSDEDNLVSRECATCHVRVIIRKGDIPTDGIVYCEKHQPK